MSEEIFASLKAKKIDLIIGLSLKMETGVHFTAREPVQHGAENTPPGTTRASHSAPARHEPLHFTSNSM